MSLKNGFSNYRDEINSYKWKQNLGDYRTVLSLGFTNLSWYFLPSLESGKNIVIEGNRKPHFLLGFWFAFIFRSLTDLKCFKQNVYMNILGALLFTTVKSSCASRTAES